MQTIQLLAVAMLLASGPACTDNTADPADPPTGGQTYSITTPAFGIGAGEEKTLCYYTSLPTDVPVGVKQYRSTMTAGSHHLIVYTTKAAAKPDGTVGDCVSARNTPTDPPVWAFASQVPQFEMKLPDGVGVMLAARQQLIVQLHYFNPSDTAIEAKATLEVFTHAPDAVFEHAAAFFTFNTQIDVPAGGTGSVSGSCDVPAGAKFVAMTTHSHRFTTRAQVRDGGAMILDTTDWEHPAFSSWSAPYQTFASGKLDYRCDYSNPTAQAVKTGESAVTDEMCMAVGYFFPAERAVACLNSTVINL